MKIHRLFILLVVFTAITATPALAQKVYVDYDRATAFSQYRTFQFKETREDLRNFSETLHRRVVSGLRSYIKEGGMEEVDAISPWAPIGMAASARATSRTSPSMRAPSSSTHGMRGRKS